MNLRLTRDESRGSSRGNARSDDDGGQAEDAAVYEATAGVLVNKYLGD
jgi:hypothetical protein